MSNSFNITRDQLSKIANGDLRVIRAFERLFDIIPTDTETNINIASTADAKANMAVGEVLKNKELTKGNKVLLWLSI